MGTCPLDPAMDRSAEVGTVIGISNFVDLIQSIREVLRPWLLLDDGALASGKGLPWTDELRMKRVPRLWTPEPLRPNDLLTVLLMFRRMSTRSCWCSVIAAPVRRHPAPQKQQ
jgi:hypothetical protein